MSATSAVLAGRRQAEALMVDSCTIKRVTGTSTDDTTGVVTPTYTTIYTGKCKLQAPGAGGRRTVAEASVVDAPLQLHLPIVGSEDVRVDDVATINASLLDAGNLGRTFHVSGLAQGSLKTARRLPVTEVTS
jgi:Family of unknown function (DUF6093)